MADHHPVVSTILAGDGITVVHFYCPCGTNRRDVLLNTATHPVARYTRALRHLHEQGQWPPVDVDLGGAEDSGGPFPKDTAA